MTRPTSQDRAYELNRLIAEQGAMTRAMRHGYKPTDEEREAIAARAARMLELTELLEVHTHAPNMSGPDPVTPDRYVNDRIASWIRTNPLPLTMQRLLDSISPPALYGLEGGVYVDIGDLQAGGYHYRAMAEDFGWSGARIEGQCMHQPAHIRPSEGGDADCDHQVVRGDMVLRIPESVAEHFRQQGRRRAQREFQQALGL